MSLLDELSIQQNIVDTAHVEVSVEINQKILQPYGVVHGGVNALLAETAASIGGMQNVSEGLVVFGINIQTNHLSTVTPVAGKKLIALATPIRLGKNVQVWEIQTFVDDTNSTPTSMSTVTLAVRPMPNKKGEQKK